MLVSALGGGPPAGAGGAGGAGGESVKKEEGDGADAKAECGAVKEDGDGAEPAAKRVKTE